MKLGDRAYIIVSGRFIREVDLIAVAGDGFIVQFVDGGGRIAVNRSRIYNREEAEAKVGKPVTGKEAPFKAQKGCHHWEVGA